MPDTRKTICPLDCPDTCALLATVENNRVLKIQGDPDHPYTRGFLCRKMRHYADRIHSPERILFPQIRDGRKGTGQFRRITWDEAWNILVTRLTDIKEKHGGEALLPYSYGGNMGQINRFAGEPFFHRYGATRLNRTICSKAAGSAWKAHCGTRAGTPPDTAADAELIIAWGINIKTTNIHFWPVIQKSRKNGGKLVVIDPYRNKTAKGADIYLPVSPGGDAALALGALKAILKDGSENRSYIETQTSGFKTLETYLQTLSWTKIEADSGISRDTIRKFAKLLAEHPRTFIRIGMGMTRNTAGAMSVRAVLCLAAALGLFKGEEGQGVLLSSGAFSGNNEALVHSSLSAVQTRQVNMVQLGETLNRLEPAIRALMIFNSNPLSIAPDSSQVRKGLKREDLFTVVHEQVVTPTARYADLLLPATTSFENNDVFTAYGHFYMGVIHPVIPPAGESISNFNLFQTLAQKMGYKDPPFFQSLEERINDYTSGLTGIDPDLDPVTIQNGNWIQSLRSRPEDSSRKVPFRFTCTDMAHDVSSFPCLTTKMEFSDPDLSSRYPLKLITPPSTHLLNSTFGEFYQNHTGRVLIHPDDAAGIQSGELVRLFNHRGSTIREASVTEDTQPGLVVAEGIFWESPADDGSGINDLTSQKTTDLGEGSTFHESRTAIERIEHPPEPDDLS